MVTIPQVQQALRATLGRAATEAARPSGFTQRHSKLTAAAFVQTLVWGWLDSPAASLTTLSQTAAAAGVRISPQGLHQRFTRAAATLLRTVLGAAVQQALAAEPVAIPLLARFTTVAVRDSTTITLPDVLADEWRGCGGRVPTGSQAAVKLQTQLDLRRGRLDGPWLQAGRAPDRDSPHQTAALPAGALDLADRMYWTLALAQARDATGAYYLFRLHPQLAVFGADGQRWDVPARLAAAGATVDVPVQLGVQARVPARLLAARVPPEVAARRRRALRAAARREGREPPQGTLALAAWNVYVTNVPAALLSVDEALVLARVRWQIELLFKLWKQHGLVDEWRSAQPERILCEVYAKLIAGVVQHWLTLLGGWHRPEYSRVQAATTIRAYARWLAHGLGCTPHLRAALRSLRTVLQAGCRLNPRRRQPNTYQLLLDPSLGALP
jgi:hypothetical protein